MRVYKTVTPKEAKAAGYQSFEAVRRGKSKDAAGLETDSEQLGENVSLNASVDEIEPED